MSQNKIKFFFQTALAIALLAGTKSFADDTTNAPPQLSDADAGANVAPALRDSAPSYSMTPETNTVTPELQMWNDEFGATHDARMQWWRAARFGMFIHWGVYSVPAGFWQGKPVNASGGEWIMNRGRIPVADYQAFTKQFDPTNFNAEQWVKIAKRAGMKYIVITSKHHDGFAMFHSQASAFNIYDATPWHRDPLAELAAACKKEGIKLGFYYSQAQDWNHPGGAAAPSKTGQPTVDKLNHWDVAQEGSMDDFIDNVDVPQIKELLSNYGPVAELWFDTPVGMNTERAEKILPLLKLQPNMVVNNRLDAKKLTGDFETPEQKIPPTGIPGKDWETCMTMNRTWGFKSADTNWKSAETIITNLVDIASKGGNYLLNVGPDSTGDIPEASVERLATVGKWMKVNGEGIYGTTASPFPTQLPWGRCTKKVGKNETMLYLHVFRNYWPSSGQLFVPDLKNKIVKAYFLKPGWFGWHKSLKVTDDPQGEIVHVPQNAPDKVSTTIVLKIKGAPEVE